MNQAKQLSKAIDVASRAHLLTLDSCGMPYILHALAVMEGVRKYGDLELMQIAVMHDVVEDSLFELKDLKDIGFSERVVTGVGFLTKEPSVSYDLYLDTVCKNIDAIKVKLADLEHNSDITRHGDELTDKEANCLIKYHKAHMKLSKDLLWWSGPHTS